MSTGTKNFAVTQFGAKLGQLPSGVTEEDHFSGLCSAIDYLEYPAPVIDFKALQKGAFGQCKQLRPHSVNLSTASPERPATSVLKRLKQELLECGGTFLGEHIGYLNPNPKGPSLGYILPPPLNFKTIQNIVQNVHFMQDFLGVPVALENPNIYTVHPDSQLTWPQFIAELSEKLPKESGWLIDFSHLYVGWRNTLDASFQDYLRAYSASHRTVFEMHLSSFSCDKDGVSHDDHATPLNEHYLKDILHRINVCEIVPLSFTVERDIRSVADVVILQKDICLVRELVCSKSQISTVGIEVLKENVVTIDSAVRSSRELAGRHKFLLRRLGSQLVTCEENDLNELALVCGEKSLQSFLASFWNWLSINEQSIGMLPYYDPTESDGIDLLLPLWEFLQKYKISTLNTNNTCQKILFELGIRKAILNEVHNSKRRVLLELNESFEDFCSGILEIRIDLEGQVIAEQSQYPGMTDDFSFFSMKEIRL
jgi:uncharacterized protein (UPF0276 family)